MRRSFKVALVAVLAILITIDTAVACRWFGGRRMRRSCACMPYTPMPSCGDAGLPVDAYGPMPEGAPMPPPERPLDRPRLDAEPPMPPPKTDVIEEPVKEPPV